MFVPRVYQMGSTCIHTQPHSTGRMEMHSHTASHHRKDEDALTHSHTAKAHRKDGGK